MTKPFLALGLAGPHLVELTTSAALLARWDALPVAFSVLGIDRIDGSPPAPLTLAASAVGATLSGATKRGRFLIAASPQRDHPYNLARRVVSLAHLSRGRSGVVIGTRDLYLPKGLEETPARAGGGGWTGRDLVDARTAYDAAIAVRALERSWPYDSIVANRDAGILVQSDRIRHVDLDNTYSIAGPLNVPEPETGPSVIAWYSATTDDLPPAGPDNPTELVLGAAGSVPVVPLGHEPPPVAVAGVVLRAGLDHSVGDLLDAAERWLAGRVEPSAVGGSLRAALELDPPAPLPTEARPAFPAPQPHAAL